MDNEIWEVVPPEAAGQLWDEVNRLKAENAALTAGRDAGRAEADDMARLLVDLRDGMAGYYLTPAQVVTWGRINAALAAHAAAAGPGEGRHAD